MLTPDVESVDELLKVADELGPYICVLKIHYDIIPDFHRENCGEKSIELKKRHNFLIWEDRKFADNWKYYGTTKRLETNVLPWADLVSIHPIPVLESVQCLSLMK